MAKSLTELIVLISCPEDLAIERQVIQSAIEEINPILRDSHDVLLRTLVWTENVLPGIGPDVQDVIDSQTVGKYDIYIGLLGVRFGRPTKRAGSGTEQEFDQAYETYKSTPAKLRVLFYFKTTVDNVFRAELDQIAKVINFRHSCPAIS